MKQIPIHVDIDEHGIDMNFDGKPVKWEIVDIKNRFINPRTIQELTVKDIADRLARGQTIQPGVTPFSEASRKKAQEKAKERAKEGRSYKPGTFADDFTRQTLFMNDIDNETDDPIAPGDVVNDLAKHNLRPAFMYETFSSTEEKIKFRYALVCDEEITDKKVRDRIQLAIVRMYNKQADQGCTNADRMFFGTDKGLIDVFTDFEAVCKKSDLLALADELKIPDNPEEAKKVAKDKPVSAAGEGEKIPAGSRHGTLVSYAQTVLKRLGICEEARDLFLKKVAQCDKPDGARVITNFEINAIWKDACNFYKRKVVTDPNYIPPEEYATIDFTPAGGNKRKSLNRLTLEEFDSILQATGFSVRLNLITGRYDTEGKTPKGRPAELDDLVAMFQDRLTDYYKGVSTKLLEQDIAFLAREHQYNPILEWLQTVTWDGVDRIQQVYELLGITDDELSKTLVYKWLLQAVALLFNGENGQKPFGAEGCLTLKGEQGCGKTSFFRHIGLDWFGEGKAIDDRDKDTKRRVVTKWITELGEVETTLKSDLEDLKNFITAKEDEYRLPYGRDDVRQPRRASMCATCNSDRYLIDTTGNRRWWTVPINRMIPWKDINALDASQLWAQIYAIVAPLPYDQKGDCFRLTEDEQNQLAIRNGDYEKPSKGQDEVADILARADRDGLRWQEMTISEFKSLWPVLHPYGSGVIGTALKRCGITSRHTKRGNFAELPVPYTNADL